MRAVKLVCVALATALALVPAADARRHKKHSGARYITKDAAEQLVLDRIGNTTDDSAYCDNTGPGSFSCRWQHLESFSCGYYKGEYNTIQYDIQGEASVRQRRGFKPSVQISQRHGVPNSDCFPIH